MKKVLTVIFVGLVIASSACGTRVPPPNRIVIGSTRDVYAIDEQGAEIAVSPPFAFYDVSAPSSRVQWSPNREWVIYQTEETASPDDPKVFIVKADGTKKFELTNHDLRSGRGPVWSPDGNQIASTFWNGFWDDNGTYGIYIVDVSCLSKGQDCIFEYRYLVRGSSPSWSFDGKQMAFLSSNKQVSVVSIENPEDVRIISPNNVECLAVGLAWSPVNNEIAASCHDTDPGLGIFLMDSDGSSFRRITFDNRDISPIWSPDGAKIAFISDKNNTATPISSFSNQYTAVFIMNPDGSNLKQISPYDNEDVYWMTWVSP
jgi:Tol biopolymer transport system component